MKGSGDALVPSAQLGGGWLVPVLPSEAGGRAEAGASPEAAGPQHPSKTTPGPLRGQKHPFSPQTERLPQGGCERRYHQKKKEGTKPEARYKKKKTKKNQKPPQTAPKNKPQTPKPPEPPPGAGGRTQRKKSVSRSWAAGSWCSTCPARKASLCAYLQGAGTRMVPGQFQ